MYLRFCYLSIFIERRYDLFSINSSVKVIYLSLGLLLKERKEKCNCFR